MSTLTDEQFAEWRKVTNAATPGPWTQEHDGSYIVHGPTGTVLESVYSCEDAAFAAAARTAMPVLLDEVERLRASNAGLSDLLDEVRANQLSILLSGPALDALETVIVDLDGEREYAVDIIERWRERLAAGESRNVVADNRTASAVETATAISDHMAFVDEHAEQLTAGVDVEARLAEVTGRVADNPTPALQEDK